MNIKIAVISIALTLTACESSNAVRTASQQGLGAMSCSQIQNVFAAVQRDKFSVEAAKQLGLATSIPFSEGVNLNRYYDLAVQAANIALIAQSCSPLSR